MTAAPLFGRTWRVQVGPLVVEEPLRVGFEIERTARSTPNSATVRLYNLGDESRSAVENAAEGLVVVEAGYRGERRQIFRGAVVRARAGGRGSGAAGPTTLERDGADSVLTVEAHDGGVEYQRARVARSYEPGVAVVTVLRDCAEALGLGEGNLREVEAVAALDGGQTTYPEGTVLTGQASRELSRILRSYGLRWSAQHGVVQVTRRGAALQSRAVVLSPTSGLIGSPEIGTRGRATVRALLSAEVWPGRRVRVESDRLEATLVVRAVKFEGDSHAEPWYAVAELAPEDS